MARWRLAPALVTLLRQVDAAYPQRSKRSDGTLGDASHRARKSDHNPDSDGTVNALDITHGPYWLGPKGTVDAGVLAADLVASNDPRLAYVIFAGRICDAGGRWRPYSGPSPHLEHIHISIVHDAKWERFVAPWQLPHFGGSQPAPLPNPTPIIEEALMTDGVTYIRHPNGTICRVTLDSWCALTAGEWSYVVALSTFAGRPPQLHQVDAAAFGNITRPLIDVAALNAAAHR